MRSEELQGIYAPLSQADDEEIHFTNNCQNVSKKLSNYSVQSNLIPVQSNSVEHKNTQGSIDVKQFHKKSNNIHRKLQNFILYHEVAGNKPCQHFDLKHSQTRPNNQTFPTSNSFHSFVMTNVTNFDMIRQGSNSSNFSSDCEYRLYTEADNVAILNLQDNKNSDTISFSRKCCLIVSILICCFTVTAFLIVPCDNEKTCPAITDRILTHNWLNNYTKIELKGMINVVNGVKIWEKNLIFLYRGDSFFSEFEQRNIKRNGIISLVGSSGAIAWFDETMEEPIAIDCDLLDINKNGTPDCLVLSEYGELGVINPISGQWYWKFKEKLKHKINALDFPIILPDLDGDNVFDILVVTKLSQEQKLNLSYQGNKENNENSALSRDNFILRILSGRTGIFVGEKYKIYDCDFLRKFQFQERQVTFICVKNGTEVQHSKTLSEIFSLITNKSIKLVKNDLVQHKQHGKLKGTDGQRNIYSIYGRELVIENRGKCPEDCNVSFILKEIRQEKTHVLRNFSSANMYGMVPVQWHFENGKSKLSGFVMKFWSWNNTTDTSLFSQGNQHRKKHNQEIHKSISLDYNINQLDMFKSLDQNRNDYTFSVKEIQMNKNITNSTKQGSRYKMQSITETVLLIIFNDAKTHIENTSQSNIVQFCRKEHEDFICQPDLNNQENSLLVADFDQDGSQELVSYYSTYVSYKDREEEKWKLVTYVQLLRLESELSSFYKSIQNY